MADVVSLSCPNCGGKLQITPDIDRFACTYCGNEHIVKRGEGIVSIAPVIRELSKITGGVDKTASELAIKRVKDEIAKLEAQLRPLEMQIAVRSGKSSSSFFPTIFIILGILLVGTGMFVQSARTGGAAILFTLGFILFVIAGIFIMRSKENKIDGDLPRLQLELENVKIRLEQKRNELENHLKIVSH